MNRSLRLATFFCLVLMLTSFFIIPAAAAPRYVSGNDEGGIKVIINDLFYSIDGAVAPDGTPMLPLRPIYELLGATVSWNPVDKTVRGKRGTTIVDLHVSSGVAVVNNERVLLNISPEIVKGVTFVPPWFIGESLGAQIDWDEENQVISIYLAPVRGISLEARELTLEQGDTEMLMASVFPDDAVNKNIIWYSTQPSVADVHDTGESSAVIAAVNPGTTIIVARTEEGGYVDTCRVKVQQAYTPVTGVVLSHASLTLVEEGVPQVITAQVLPETATEQGISWNSSNTGVATVHRHAVGRAIVVPLKEGWADITVTTEEGEYMAFCRVKVLP